jgi:hypothetical protein
MTTKTDTAPRQNFTLTQARRQGYRPENRWTAGELIDLAGDKGEMDIYVSFGHVREEMFGLQRLRQVDGADHVEVVDSRGVVFLRHPRDRRLRILVK